jgi:FKBP-type peptidyl-prolyl cis-trans isomerase FkpA
MKRIFPLLVLLLVVASCAKRKAEKQAKEDDQIIQDYIEAHNLTATKTSSGLYVVIEQQGTGAACNSYSTVRASYAGYFTDGSVFDESTASGVVFDLQSVIPGWTEGIPYFKVGGYGKLLIPSALAYGTKGTVGIPPNTVLIFDVALLEVL